MQRTVDRSSCVLALVNRLAALVYDETAALCDQIEARTACERACVSVLPCKIADGTIERVKCARPWWAVVASLTV